MRKLGKVSTSVEDILKFWGGLLVALLGLVLFVGGGLTSMIEVTSMHHALHTSMFHDNPCV